jgi:hypothetical protein
LGISTQELTQLTNVSKYDEHTMKMIEQEIHERSKNLYEEIKRKIGNVEHSEDMETEYANAGHILIDKDVI